MEKANKNFIWKDKFGQQLQQLQHFFFAISFI